VVAGVGLGVVFSWVVLGRLLGVELGLGMMVIE
jgi:hypothetical protein